MNDRHRAGVLVAVALALSSVSGEGSEVDTWRERAVVVTRSDQPRELRWELVVPAAPDALWRAWTEVDEITKWAGPGAAVDLRPGGAWEIHFFPDRPPGERGGDASAIIDFTPGKEIRIAAGAPMEFPTVRREKTIFHVMLSPVGTAHTLVLATQTGWKTGEEWDRAFEKMASANAEWLNWLHERFVVGPKDWTVFTPGMGS